ncbi:hypothetical protein VNI00_016069 [Paramarasmius palmivorus]|uniref:Uncharacterized protein n=1 Tax=Paramarasmius palmivorus TaxID=297713 RepID=A0AAW0BGF7_9AGAR
MSQLDADSVLQCLDEYLRQNGSWRSVELLRVSHRLVNRLYPLFYRNIVLLSSRNLYPLIRTLENYPERAGLIRTMWVRVGREAIYAPAAVDNTYPKDYYPFHRIIAPMRKLDIQPLAHTISMTAPYLTRLTISANRHYPQLREVFRVLNFPHLVELGAPVDLISSPTSANFFGGLPNCPALRKLRIAYNAEKDACDVPNVLAHQDFTVLPQLTHLYLSYWAEYQGAVVNSLLKLLVPSSLQTLIIELDSGNSFPISYPDLNRYRIHPLAVFLVKKGAYSDVERVVGPTARMALARQVCALLDVEKINGICVWDIADEKVAQRWVEYNSHESWPPKRVICRIGN